MKVFFFILLIANLFARVSLHGQNLAYFVTSEKEIPSSCSTFLKYLYNNKLDTISCDSSMNQLIFYERRNDVEYIKTLTLNNEYKTITILDIVQQEFRKKTIVTIDIFEKYKNDIDVLNEYTPLFVFTEDAKEMPNCCTILTIKGNKKFILFSDISNLFNGGEKYKQFNLILLEMFLLCQE